MDTAVKVAELIASLGTAAGLVAAIWVYKRQANAQVFLEYTRRYDEVMRQLPSHARIARTKSASELPEQTEELTYRVLDYLNLCSEEFYLWKTGYLSDRIWSIWEAELRRTLATPLLKREWQSLRNEFISYPEFQSYVEAA